MSEVKIRTGRECWRMTPVDEIAPYACNAKIHGPEQIKRLRESLRAFGFVRPLLVDEKGRLLAGHGMLEAAKAEGLERVPCVIVEGLTDAQRRAYVHADNKLAELAGWDEAMLALELPELGELGIDMAALGFEGAQGPAEPLELEHAGKDGGPTEADSGEVLHCPKCGFAFEVYP